MFYELREYFIRFEFLREFLTSYEEVGLPLLKRSGFELVGAWLPDIGVDSATTFTWLLRWRDMNERTRAYAAFRADPDYPAFGHPNAARILKMDSRILAPLSFSPLQ